MFTDCFSIESFDLLLKSTGIAVIDGILKKEDKDENVDEHNKKVLIFELFFRILYMLQLNIWKSLFQIKRTA